MEEEQNTAEVQPGAGEADQPPATEEGEEIDVTQSVVFEEDGPTSRKIQTEFTVPLKAKAKVVAAAGVAAGKGGEEVIPGSVFQPCGDMPLPPGADPMQWGFPEFCPRKMLRYAEAAAEVAAAAEAAEAADAEVALPGEAVDTHIDDAVEEPGGEAEPVDEEVVEGEEVQPVNLSVLSAELPAALECGEMELEKSSSDIFMDAIGTEEHEEWYSDSDLLTSSERLAIIHVDIEVEVPSAGVAHADSVEFQAPAAAEEAAIEAPAAAEEAEIDAPDAADEAEIEAPTAAEEAGSAQEEAVAEQAQWPSAAPQPQLMDADDATAPVLWKIEQDIAVVRTKLSEMQQKITALDIPELPGGAKPTLRRKCVCDPQKRAAERGLPPAAPALPEERFYHSAPALQQYSQRRSFTAVAQEFKPFPQMGGGVDIYIASRSGNTSAVTSISPANLQQYAEKPVLKAFGSPDVDVYVVTDNIGAPGYSGQN